ncbi:MAG: bacterial regulatory s, tetR family protein [Candidatus Eremiobacteraeota bacterium]|nr:bacterial regulatory s, tetR family protein [Candidatus Eremiobacteraeota bacterium]
MRQWVTRGMRATVRTRRPWTEAIPDRDERRRLKRQAILDQAARLFYQRGYHETTLDDIAAALAVTKPTLYYYVRSKEDILVQILSDALAFARATFDAAHREGGDGLARLRIFARRYVEAMTLPPGRCLLTMRATPLAPKTRAQLNASFRQMDTLARELIEEGIADGSIAPCDVRMAAFALFGAINTVPFWFHDEGSMSASEAGDALFAIVERALTAHSST